MTYGKVDAWRGEIVPERRGNITERTTCKFEARTDGWAEKCDKGRRTG
jgi:hypothetical protein